MAIKKTQTANQTTLRFYLTLVKIAIIKKNKETNKKKPKTNVGKEAGGVGMEPLYTIWWAWKLV
jgi:hypothetical protein